MPRCCHKQAPQTGGWWLVSTLFGMMIIELQDCSFSMWNTVKNMDIQMDGWISKYLDWIRPAESGRPYCPFVTHPVWEARSTTISLKRYSVLWNRTAGSFGGCHSPEELDGIGWVFQFFSGLDPSLLLQKSGFASHPKPASLQEEQKRKEERKVAVQGIPTISWSWFILLESFEVAILGTIFGHMLDIEQLVGGEAEMPWRCPAHPVFKRGPFLIVCD